MNDIRKEVDKLKYTYTAEIEIDKDIFEAKELLDGGMQVLADEVISSGITEVKEDG